MKTKHKKPAGTPKRVANPHGCRHKWDMRHKSKRDYARRPKHVKPHAADERIV